MTIDKFNLIFLSFNILLSAIICVQYMSLYNVFHFQSLFSAFHNPQNQTELQPTPTPTPVNKADQEIPLDVFDVDLYYSLYPDLQRAFGFNHQKLIYHYYKYGLYEGRKMSYVFNVYYYYTKYKDLQTETFPSWSKLYTHFFTYGINEGRAGTEEFNVSYYKEHNDDLKHMTNREAIVHFLTFGINEGRPTSKYFNVITYKNNYEDLQKEFGDNFKKYFKHYVMYGKNERRKAT